MREMGLTYTAAERQALGLPPRRPHAIDGEISRRKRLASDQAESPTAITGNGVAPSLRQSSVLPEIRSWDDALHIEVSTADQGDFTIMISGKGTIALSNIEEGN